MPKFREPEHDAKGGPASARDPGSSLIEILISVVLLGTLGLAVIGAAFTSAVTARTNSDLADNQAILASAGSFLSNEHPYVACDEAGVDLVGDGQAAIDQFLTELLVEGQSEPDVSIDQAAFWTMSSNDPSSGSFGATCDPAQRLQQFRLTLTPQSGSPQSLVVVKRPFDEQTCFVLGDPTFPDSGGGTQCP